MTSKPKGLRLFDNDSKESRRINLVVAEGSKSADWEGPRTLAGYATVGNVFLDADQLDKLAERCKQWSKYLRSQKGKKPVVKKWGDL